MKARMLSVFGWIRDRLAQAPSTPARDRRRPSRGPARFEALERREVLSSATFVPFATLPGQVATAGQPAQVGLHFSAGQVVSTQSTSVLVGFYVEAANGSTATPQVSEVDGPSGPLTPVSIPRRDHSTPSKSLYVTYLPTSPTAAEDITVKVIEPGKQVGQFTLEAFLPGDANADHSVNPTDLALVQAAYGSGLGRANFNPAADFNADGHVGCIDLRLTEMNQGAHVTYGPPAAITAAPIPAPVSIPQPVVTPAPVAAVIPTPAVTPVVVATPATIAPVAVPVVAYVPVATYAYPQAGGRTLPAAPAYYYGQPVVQAPGSAQATAASPSYFSYS